LGIVLLDEIFFFPKNFTVNPKPDKRPPAGRDGKMTGEKTQLRRAV